MKKFLSTALGLVFFSSAAFARDSSLLSCSGVVGEGQDGIALTLTVHNYRAPDGEKRVEVVSAIYQDKLFQERRLESGLESDKDVPLTLVDTSNLQSKLFKGVYTLIHETIHGQEVEGDNDYIQLDGKLNLMPNENDPRYIQPIFVALPCKDLSV